MCCGNFAQCLRIPGRLVQNVRSRARNLQQELSGRCESQHFVVFHNRAIFANRRARAVGLSEQQYTSVELQHPIAAQNTGMIGNADL